MNKEDNKPQSTFTKEEVAKMMKEALADGIAMANAMQAREEKAAPAAVPFMRTNPTRCPECRQYSAACKGEHRLAVVWPEDPEAAEWFTGVKINGVRYISNGPGHFITVPKDCNVEYIVAEYNRNDKRQRMGRKHSRHSGSIGGGSNNFNAYNGGEFSNR